MNQHLQSILNSIQQDKNLSEEEKNAILKSLKDADKEFEITNFKLDRTEKVKRTTAILLEETIEELEHKRKAVEAQNRELEIESSLERVRAQALSMRKPDDLPAVCEVLFSELSTLGFTEMRNAMINIYDDEKATFINYDYSDEIGKSTNHLRYDIHPVIEKQIRQMRSAGDAFSETWFKDKDLEDWKSLRKQVGEKDDPRIENTDALYYYFYSIGTGSIGISTFSAIAEEKLKLLKRFRNVFNLSYQRYTDIALAEAQAHEAKIEASLERMRAAAMSMQKSDDVLHVSESMYKELTALGFTNIRNAQIAVKNEAQQAYTAFEYSDFGAVKGEAAYNSSHMVQELYNELGNTKDSFYQKEFSGNEFEEWRKWRKSLPVSPDNRIDSATSVCFYLYSFGTGHLGISTFNPITTAQIEILKRFKKVFELSYQRYTDVAKAEEQAKEAKIELALERVRARTMAMQKSDELGETAFVLFQQFEELSEDPEQIGIGIMNEEEKIMELWSTINGKMRDHVVKVSLDEPVIMRKLYSAWKEEKKTFVVDISGKDLEDYNNYRNSIADIKLDVNRTKDRRVISVAYFSKGLVSLATPEPRPAETLQLLERFANVFDLTYTRFLDLKNAEAQTRAAQVELAVERVRAKALAMHNSTQILDVVSTLRNEMLGLEIPGVVAATIYLKEEEEGYIRMWDLSSVMEMEDGFHVALDVKFKLEETDPGLYMRRVWNSNENYFVEKQEEKDMAITIEWLRQYYPEKADEVQQFLNTTPWKYLLHPTIQLAHGKMSVDIMDTQPPAEMESILLKMGTAFDLAYKRFLDLQKSEKQIREAQIELALERVRARTMAMQHSDELADASLVLFKQIKDLGFETWSCGFCTWQKNDMVEVWMGADAGGLLPPMLIPYKKEPTHKNIYEASLTGEPAHDKIWDSQALEDHYTYLKTIPSVKDAIEILEGSGLSLPKRQCYYVGFFEHGYLLLITKEPNDELKDLSKRFANVFNQTYTRFLDLQKAEAQSRESQIQLALERARSQSMIMQHSKELDDTLRVFHEQVLLLGIPSAFSFLWLPDENNERHIFWAAWKENPPSGQAGENDSALFKSKAINYPLDRNEAATAQCLLDWKSNEPVYSYHVPPAAVENYFTVWQELIDGVEHLKPEYFSGGLHYVEAFMKYGCFGVMVTNDLNEDEKKILGRFAIEFERTYRRFLDLQKAEAQAREAQVETALEKVRSRTMAMQRSDELSGTAALLFQEFKKLEQQELIQITIGIYNEAKNEIEFRATDWEGHGEQIDRPAYGSMEEPTLLKPAVTAWKAGSKSLVADLTGKALDGWVSYRNKMTGTTISSKDAGGRRVVSIAFFSKGHLSLSSPLPLPAETVKTLERFAAVFDGTYTRFLDLKKAEAQAREAQIETALEKVRSRSLAMHKSEEILEVVRAVFERLNDLKIELNTAFIIIFKENSRDTDWWLINKDKNEFSNIVVKYADLSLMKDMFGAKELGKELFSATYHAEEKNKLFRYLFTETDFKYAPAERQKFIYDSESVSISMAMTNKIAIQITRHNEQSFSDEDNEILRRFTKVFDQSYTRFNDLQKAEAQAREAQIEAALERVRSRTLAMQKSDELAETAAVMFQQLITLGIEPNRLYIAIVKDNDGNTEFWITDEDGSKVSSAFETNLNDNATFKKMFDGWKAEKRSLVIDMQGEELQGYFKYLTSIHVPFKAGLTQKRRVQDIAYFSNGFIGMASPEEQPAATLQLLERFAYVFNLTFTRFNDLKLAEAHSIQAEEDLIKLQTEKKRAEDALTELRATQTQLIQSEKMASLGELTAGIAHEIQNPLNFVNNFSEVSVELIEELKSEKSKPKSERDDQLEEELLNDITQNLEKINHHGKRADAIVKGMLQHSRTTSSTKEPTDINKLADEYLRLAYHGLRAKDKSFNSTLKTDYDERIDKINVIPQDIGRVVLNLITNAFYATGEKKKQSGNAYEPIVSVTTKSTSPPSGGRGVNITIADNGNGIPQNILDKIFQPFFTTKPTGQGTGLGLSLAYDIVKAHGGELKVETTEGSGSIFIIQLPNN